MFVFASKIDSTGLLSVLFSLVLCFSFNASLEACTTSLNEECINANNIDATLGSSNCYTACTEGASPGEVVNGFHTCSTMPFPTVWFRVSTGADNGLVDLTVNSLELNSPVIGIYTGSCAALESVNCYQGINGTVNLENTRLTANSFYWFAVSSGDGSVGSLICA